MGIPFEKALSRLHSHLLPIHFNNTFLPNVYTAQLSPSKNLGDNWPILSTRHSHKLDLEKQLARI